MPTCRPSGTAAKRTDRRFGHVPWDDASLRRRSADQGFAPLSDQVYPSTTSGNRWPLTGDGWSQPGLRNGGPGRHSHLRKMDRNQSSLFCREIRISFEINMPVVAGGLEAIEGLSCNP
jgi:hypothetical protein